MVKKSYWFEPDPHDATEAEQEGFRTIFANPLEPRTIKRAETDVRTGVLALSPSEETNYLFGLRAKNTGKAKRVPARHDGDRRWRDRCDARKDRRRGLDGQSTGGRQVVAAYSPAAGQPPGMEDDRSSGQTHRRRASSNSSTQGLVLPLTLRREGRVTPIGTPTDLRPDDQLTVLLAPDQKEEARVALEARAFERVWLRSATSCIHSAHDDKPKIFLAR